jgi:CRP-like cAMP-binding protein
MEKSVLQEIFNANEFSKAERDLIISSYAERSFLKGEVLLHEGKIASHYWFVESGFIRSFATDLNGNDVTTHFYSRRDVVIDWPSFFLRNPMREQIHALTDCVCWQLDFGTFQEFFHSMEAFREAGRSRLVKSYFELKAHRVSLITDQAKDRYLRLLHERPELIQNVSLKHIASYLGVTDTSLSRIRKEVAKGI